MINGRFTSLKSNGIITDPRWWQTSSGYEFLLKFGSADMLAASSSTNDGIPAYGWVVTSLVGTDGTSGDLLSAADVTPTHALADASGDALTSPRIFGSYDHALQAARYLGYQPTRLVLEFYAAFTVSSANEATTFIGLHWTGGTNATASGSAACIYSNGTNFICAGDTNSDTGAAIDTAWHTWKIIIDSATTEWFIDEVSQGSYSTEQDIWPLSLRMSIGTTNRIGVSWVRIYYE